MTVLPFEAVYFAILQRSPVEIGFTVYIRPGFDV